MIDPLRMTMEVNPPVEINRPVFCGNCLSLKASRNNPNIAVRVCDQCKPPSIPVKSNVIESDSEFASNTKRTSLYLCLQCDTLVHKTVLNRDHTRKVLVVGPAVTKRLITRGDEITFPQFLDSVKVKVKCSVYHNGRRLHTERPRYLHFTVGLSGKSIHMQVLGGAELLKADADGSSDPFVVYNYCGRQISCTRVRPRSLFPRWDNETFIVPLTMGAMHRGLAQSQKEVVKLEVFDHDWFSQNDFLGHVELSIRQLQTLTSTSNGQALMLPLTMKETHGTLKMKLGFSLPQDEAKAAGAAGQDQKRDAADEEAEAGLYVQLLEAENLDKVDTEHLSSPYAKVYCCVGAEERLVGTTPTAKETIHPDWARLCRQDKRSRNVFRVLSLQDLLQWEAQRRDDPDPVAIPSVHSQQQQPQSQGGSSREEQQYEQLLQDDESSVRSSHDLLLFQELRKSAAALQQPQVHRLVAESAKDPLSLPEQGGGELKVLRIDIWSRRRTPPHVQLGQVTVTLSMLRSVVPDLPFSLYQDPSLPPSPSNPNLNPNSNSLDADPSSGSSGRGWDGAEPEPPASAAQRILRYCMDTAATVADALTSLLREEDPGPVSDDPSPQPQEGAQLIEKDSGAASSGIHWGFLTPMAVLKLSSKAKADLTEPRGSLILRLLPATRGEVVVGLDEGVRTMSLGEKCELKCRYDALYMNYSMGPSIPPRANMLLTVELCQVNGKGLWGQDKPLLQLLRRTRRRTKKLLGDWWRNYMVPWMQWLCRVGRLSGGGLLSVSPGRSRRREGGAVRDGGEEDSDDGDRGEDDHEEDDGEDDEEDEDDEQPYEDEEEEMAVAVDDGRVRPDPRMKKHLSKAVKIGHKIIWGYQPRPKSRVRRHQRDAAARGARRMGPGQGQGQHEDDEGSLDEGSLEDEGSSVAEDDGDGDGDGDHGSPHQNHDEGN